MGRVPLPPHTVTRAVASLADESASVGWTMLVDALAERGVQVVEGRAPDGRWIEHGELTASVVGSHDDAALVDSLVRAALVRRAPREDLVVLVSTILVTLFFDLTYAIGLGMVVSMVLLKVSIPAGRAPASVTS